MVEMMKAIRLDGPGSYKVLTPTKVPKPDVQPGWVRIPGQGVRGQ